MFKLRRHLGGNNVIRNVCYPGTASYGSL